MVKQTDNQSSNDSVNDAIQQPTGQQPTGGLIQSVDRAMQIMQLLSENGVQTVSQVATHLDVHKSTASRLLATLEHHGVVEQYQARGSYRLGLALVGYTNNILKDFNILDYARPVCEHLGRISDETVNVAVVVGKNVVNIDQVMGSAAVASVNWIGKHTPIHATSSGKVLLAYLPYEKSKAMIDDGFEKFTSNTLFGHALEEQLVSIRQKGFAIAIDEFEQGLTAVAAPVFNSTGSIEAAISISGPTFRMQQRVHPELSQNVKKAADEVSAMLGYKAR